MLSRRMCAALDNRHRLQYDGFYLGKLAATGVSQRQIGQQAIRLGLADRMAAR